MGYEKQTCAFCNTQMLASNGRMPKHLVENAKYECEGCGELSLEAEWAAPAPCPASAREERFPLAGPVLEGRLMSHVNRCLELLERVADPELRLAADAAAAAELPPDLLARIRRLWRDARETVHEVKVWRANHDGS